MNWMRKLKKLGCNHTNVSFLRNISGDEINYSGGRRSTWVCDRCGEVILDGPLFHSPKVFSFDAETDGLWGRPFALSAVVYDSSPIGNTLTQMGQMYSVVKTGHPAKSFVGYLGPDAVTDGWVRENVLPALKELEPTHDSYESMLSDFAAFYMQHKSEADIIAHIGVPVESQVIEEMHRLGLIGEWDAPFPMIDVGSVLKGRSENPLSVDEYNARHQTLRNFPEVCGLSPHHPLYDSIAAAAAYYHLLGKKVRQ